MDILAHSLWAGAGVTLAQRHWHLSPRTLALTVLLAALPDLLQFLPIIAWGMFGDGSLADVWRFTMALPGEEPALPPMVNLWAHHLHCIMHSAVVAGAATLLSWMVWRTLLFALLGWWSHIVIDVFTHSASYYPSPVLYPITEQGFDGLAWNTPWFLVANYVALGLTAVWLFRSRENRHKG